MSKKQHQYWTIIFVIANVRFMTLNMPETEVIHCDRNGCIAVVYASKLVDHFFGTYPVFSKIDLLGLFIHNQIAVKLK